MKALLSLFFLPPGVLLVALMILALFVFQNRHERRLDGPWSRMAISMWIVGVALLGWIVATPAFGLFLSHILVNNVRGRELPDPRQADMIVVLTGGMIDAGPVGWIPKPEGIHRLAVAYELQRMINLRLPVIISGGHTEGGQNPSEATVTASFFAHQRTELTPTELEESSTDTYESALQLAPVLAKRGVKNPLLVTSDVHMLRAAATFRARGMDVIPAPALVLPVGLGVKAYLPSVYGMGLTADALYELFGTAVYLLSGRFSWADLTYTLQEDGQPVAVVQPAAPAGADATLPPPRDPAAPITIEEPEKASVPAVPAETAVQITEHAPAPMTAVGKGEPAASAPLDGGSGEVIR